MSKMYYFGAYLDEKIAPIEKFFGRDCIGMCSRKFEDIWVRIDDNRHLAIEYTTTVKHGSKDLGMVDWNVETRHIARNFAISTILTIDSECETLADVYERYNHKKLIRRGMDGRDNLYR